MKITVIISTMLISQVTASFFDVFQSAVSSVQNSVGKLFKDVVTDVKETVDCTILAVEHALALRADADQLYNDKRGNGTKNSSSQSQQVEKKNPVVEIPMSGNEEYLRKQVPEQIDIRINDTLTKFLNSCNSSDKLEEIKIELAKETQKLADVSEFVKMELDRSSDEIQFDAGNLKGNESKPSVDNILDQLKLLETVEKNVQNNHEATEIHKIIDNVLHKLNSIESTEAAQNVKVENILKDLENNSDASYKDIRQQLNELKQDEYKHLDFIQNKIDEHEKSPDRAYFGENHEKVIVTSPVVSSSKPEPRSTTLMPTTFLLMAWSIAPEPTSTIPKPMSHTPEPISTTTEPISTTSESIYTTPEPVSTTSERIVTKPGSSSTTSLLTTTTAVPTWSALESTSTVEPSTTTPEPILTTPEPTITTSETTSAKSESTFGISKPSFTTEFFTSTTSMPTLTTSTPTSITSEFTSITPVVTSTTQMATWSTQEPLSPTLEPLTTTPEPSLNTTEPTTTTLETTYAKPESTFAISEARFTAALFTSTTPMPTSTPSMSISTMSEIKSFVPVGTSTTPVSTCPTPERTSTTTEPISATPESTSDAPETTSAIFEPTYSTAINISAPITAPEFGLPISNEKISDIINDKEHMPVDNTTNNTLTSFGTTVTPFSMTDQSNSTSESFAPSTFLASSTGRVETAAFFVAPNDGDDIPTNKDTQDTSSFLAIAEFPRSAPFIETLFSTTNSPEITQGDLESSTLSKRSKDNAIGTLMSTVTRYNAIPTTRINAVRASLPLNEFTSAPKENNILQMTTPLIITTQAYENFNRHVEETTNIVNVYSSTLASNPVITTLVPSLPHTTNQELSNKIVKETMTTTTNVPLKTQAEISNNESNINFEESTENVYLENISKNNDTLLERNSPLFPTNTSTAFSSTTQLTLLPPRHQQILSGSDEMQTESAIINSTYGNKYEDDTYSTTTEPSHSTALMRTNEQNPVIETTEAITTESLESEETTESQEAFEYDYKNESSVDDTDPFVYDYKNESSADDTDPLELETSEIVESSEMDDYLESEESSSSSVVPDLQISSTILPPENLPSEFTTIIPKESFAYTQNTTVQEFVNRNTLSTVAGNVPNSPTLMPPNQKYTETPLDDNRGLVTPPMNQNVEILPPPQPRQFNDNPPTFTPLKNFLRPPDEQSLNNNGKSIDLTTPLPATTLKAKDLDDLDSDSFIPGPMKNFDDHVKVLKEAQQLIADNRQEQRIFESIRNSTGTSLFG